MTCVKKEPTSTSDTTRTRTESCCLNCDRSLLGSHFCFFASLQEARKKADEEAAAAAEATEKVDANEEAAAAEEEDATAED